MIFNNYDAPMNLIERIDALDRIKSAFRVHPVVALLGPRQCGGSVSDVDTDLLSCFIINVL
jgi:hypothetical protein